MARLRASFLLVAMELRTTTHTSRCTPAQPPAIATDAALLPVPTTGMLNCRSPQPPQSDDSWHRGRWAKQGSNLRPPRYQRGTLTAELLALVTLGLCTAALQFAGLRLPSTTL